MLAIIENEDRVLDAEAVFRQYGDFLFRLSLIMLRSEQDALDAVQDTMLRYMTKAPSFRDEEHRRAWLITVVRNLSRNQLRFRLRHPTTEEIPDIAVMPEEGEFLLEKLQILPEKYRMVIYLYYGEEYSVKEIAGILGISESAADKRLQRGRTLLKEKWEGNYAF